MRRTKATAPVSMRVRYLTRSISIRTTGYVTEQLLVVKSVVVVFSQIEELYFLLHFTHDLLLRHSGDLSKVNIIMFNKYDTHRVSSINKF